MEDTRQSALQKPPVMGTDATRNTLTRHGRTMMKMGLFGYKVEHGDTCSKSDMETQWSCGFVSGIAIATIVALLVFFSSR